MGLNSGMKEYLSSEEIKYTDLKGKTLAIDTYNALYQFLASIRDSNGNLLTRNGTVVSHLYGILWRYGFLLSKGVKLVFVFDGKPIALKANEIKQRQAEKEKNKDELARAEERGDIEAIKTYKKRVISITNDILNTTKRLITLLGCDYVEAPAEGEVQAVYLVKENIADYVSTQDYDTLLYGCDNIIRNLGVRWKGKLLTPVIIKSTNVFKLMGINMEKFRRLAFLTGTDYNKGIYGIGVKRGIRLVQETNSNEELVDKLVEDERIDSSEKTKVLEEMKEVLNTISNPIVNTKESLNITKGKFDPDELRKFLAAFNFNVSRFEKIISGISEINANNSGNPPEIHTDQFS